MSHDENEHDCDDHDCHHHHNPEIKVAFPVANEPHDVGFHGQPLPGIYENPNPNAVITELPGHILKIVITYSINTFTYFVQPVGDGLKITTLLPHGIIARPGNNGEIYIEPIHRN